MNDNINAREIEILKQVPEGQRLDFIEQKGEQMRSLIEDAVQLTNEEIMQALAIGYRGL